MRYFQILFAVLLIGAANASSQEPSDHKPITHKEQKSEKKKAAAKNEVSAVEKPKTDIIEDASHKTDAHAEEKLSLDRKLVEYTKQLAIYTKELSKYTSDVSRLTLWLVIVTGILGVIGLWQGKQLKRSVDSAENAVIPVISPYIVDTDQLHPSGLDPNSSACTFDSSIKFVFENYGKTPGIIREVRAELLLVENDILPKVTFEALALKHHELIIPGNTRASIIVEPFPVLPLTLSPQTFNEILAEAKTGQFRRFYLIGLVVYDDFFDTRHLKRFCLKIRKSGYHAPHGGIAYNSVSRKKIPKNA